MSDGERILSIEVGGEFVKGEWPDRVALTRIETGDVAIFKLAEVGADGD